MKLCAVFFFFSYSERQNPKFINLRESSFPFNMEMELILFERNSQHQTEMSFRFFVQPLFINRFTEAHDVHNFRSKPICN